MYKLTKSGVRRSDGAEIPNCPDNRDWQDYLIWISEGNTPEPMDPEPVPTVAELRRKAYEAEGITDNALAVALWEKLIENKPEAADAIQVKRQAIKERIPK